MIAASEDSYEYFVAAILCALREATDNQGGGEFSLRHLAAAKDIESKSGWVDRATSDLYRLGYVALTHEVGADQRVQITNSGRVAVGKLLFPSRTDSSAETATMPSSSFRDKELSYNQFKELTLIALYDRYTDVVDEAGSRIEDAGNYPYCIRKVIEAEGFRYRPEWIDQVISDFHYAEWISHQGHNEGGDDVALLNAGGFAAAELLVEKYYDTSSDQPLNAWKVPDVARNISVRSVETAKKHVADAMHVIATSKFTQEEKAQIIGLLKICEQILDLPTPKISLLGKIVSMLYGIKEIAGIVKALKDLFS